MKITKSELSQIIKEEAQRFIAIQKLKAEKVEIEKMLNESYVEEDLEEGAFGDAIGRGVDRFMGGVAKVASRALTSKEEREAGKKNFDKKFSEFKSWLEGIKQKGWTDEDVVLTTDTENLKGWNKENEEKFIKNADNFGFIGNLVYKTVPSQNKIIVHFSPGSLSGAGGQGGGVVKKDPRQKNENLSESQIRRIAREEAFRAEKLKQLQERADNISKKLNNL
jgi:hypothetical protein